MSKFAQALMVWLYFITGACFADELSFEWIDFSGQSQTITLTIPLSRLQEGMLSGKDQISLKHVLSDAFMRAQAIAVSSSASDQPMRVIGTADNFFFAPKSRDATGSDKANYLKQQLADEINKSENRGYFIFDQQVSGLRPDYLSIIEDNKDIFLEAARRFTERFGRKDPLELINQLLSFLQQIPYDDMLNQPFPMATPIQMLVEKRGDCEAKQIFLVGVLKVLFPDRELALINLPEHNHILSAIRLDVLLPSQKMRKGIAYVMMDATGPARLPFGKVALYYLNSTPSVWITL